ncbi:MAG: hypothetical protein K2N94_11485, partial [Lachnospiraceae bacterium]|nr:hypothetical protein [Lachnospiraceae bacterium]
MKRKFKLVVIGSFFAVLIIILVCLAVFITKTMSVNDTYQYCINNTTVGATSFIRYGIGSESSYAFWVAGDGVSDLQELFIFRKTPFGLIESTAEWDRFSFVYHASTGLDEIVDSVMFTPRDSKNQKKTINVIVFYSSNKYNISRHIFTIEENG